MPKSVKRRGYQNNNLVAGVLLVWILVIALGGSMMLVAASTMLEPVPTLLVQEVPVENLSHQQEASSAQDELSGISVLEAPTPVLPEATPTALPVSVDPPEVDNGVVIEPSLTPASPPSPTPVFLLPQTAFSEGPLVIGYTVEGRPLEVYRFGTGPVRRMIVAGIHGGYEANTIALADQLIAYIGEHPEYIPATVTLYILRNLNPDGYARAKGIEGRANQNKVDLNRNFPINWADTWSRSGCWNYLRLTAGSEPGSEPETQALMAYVSLIRPTAMISYHSAALGIFPGGEPADPESVSLAQALAEVSSYPYPPIDTGCFYTGTLPDWAVSKGIAAVDLELHTHKFTDFDENLKVISAFMQWRRK